MRKVRIVLLRAVVWRPTTNGLYKNNTSGPPQRYYFRQVVRYKKQRWHNFCYETIAFYQAEQILHVWNSGELYQYRFMYGSAALTCSPSGWSQSWLHPSGCRSPAAVEWSGSPAAPSPAGTTHKQQVSPSPSRLSGVLGRMPRRNTNKVC